jgi:hypothetical protein
VWEGCESGVTCESCMRSWKSIWSVSEVNRLRMRPEGTVSKKSIGAARMELERRVYEMRAARSPITTPMKSEREKTVTPPSTCRRRDGVMAA